MNDDLVSQFIFDNKDIVLDELNVKEIVRIDRADNLISYSIKPNLKTLGKKYGSGLVSIKNTLLDNQSKWVQMMHDKNKIELSVDEKVFLLEKEDVFIDSYASEGFSAVSGGGITVGLSLELTNELIQEGIVRDLVRHIQNMRKAAGFAVEDRIEIYWNLDSQIQESVTKFEEYLTSETLTNKVHSVFDKGDYDSELIINDTRIKIGIKK